MMDDHLAFSGGHLQAPLNPLKTMFRGGRHVFQVGQAPSGPTVIRPLKRNFPFSPAQHTHDVTIVIHLNL